jgi:Tfp pilus assembly protein PilN
VAIKVNVLRRQAPKPSGGIASGISMPKIQMPGGRLMPLVGMACAAVLLAILAWGYVTAQTRRSEEAKIKTLDAQDQQLQLQLTELRLADAARKEIKRRLDIIGRVAKSQKVPTEVMTGILRAVPMGIWLTGVDMKPQEVKVKVDPNRAAISYSSDTLNKLAAKDRELAQSGQPAKPPAGPQLPAKEVTEIQGFSIVVKGKAFNNFQVAEFMENLRKAGAFSDVDFTVTQAENVASVRVMDFEVTASVKL